jgi:hypothetical protein
VEVRLVGAAGDDGSEQAGTGDVLLDTSLNVVAP